MTAKKYPPGSKKGRWLVLSLRQTPKGVNIVRVRCDCGEEKELPYRALLGNSNSCGCLRRELTIKRCTTHGESKGSYLYELWVQIKNRCENRRAEFYPHYGGRGVGIHRLWSESYEEFAAHIRTVLGERPSKKHSLDRIDNDKGYLPGNLRWATQTQQCNNKSNNVFVEHLGEKRTVPGWSRETGINKGTLYERLFILGWPVEKALSTPVAHKKTPVEQTMLKPTQ